METIVSNSMSDVELAVSDGRKDIMLTLGGEPFCDPTFIMNAALRHVDCEVELKGWVDQNLDCQRREALVREIGEIHEYPTMGISVVRLYRVRNMEMFIGKVLTRLTLLKAQSEAFYNKCVTHYKKYGSRIGITAWGKMLGSYQSYIDNMQRLAEYGGAPVDAVYMDDDKWTTFGMVNADSTRKTIAAVVGRV